MFSRPAGRMCAECAGLRNFAPRPFSSSSRGLQPIQRNTIRPNARRSVPFARVNGASQYRRAGTFSENAKSLFKEYPYSVSLALFFILAGASSVVYVNYVYQTYIIAAFHNYPEPVAVKLRRALYFTNTDLDPKQAVKYYKQAIEVAEEEGMDAFSNEVIGIKIQVAALMEKIQNYPKATEVLEIVRADCIKWLGEQGKLEPNRGQRTQVLSKTVAISAKLSELYSNPYVMEKEAAEERLVWAVDTAIKEKQRREKEGVKEDEGAWLSDDEMGASLEALAHTYEEKDRHYLAAPLFLQALASKPREDCHSVVLMNNLATSLAQQTPPGSTVAPASRSALVESARTWAQKAIDVAAKITPPERTEECDVGCAVALHNLGEFAEMNSDLAEARKRYKEAASLARAIGFAEGAKNSQEGLRRLAAGSAIDNV